METPFVLPIARWPRGFRPFESSWWIGMLSFGLFGNQAMDWHLTSMKPMWLLLRILPLFLLRLPLAS